MQFPKQVLGHRFTGSMLLDISKFLGHKKDMWEHPTGLRIDDEEILRKTAKNLAELHQARGFF